MTITIECRKCGHLRTATLDALQSGRWLKDPCPVCGRSRKDELASVRASAGRKDRKHRKDSAR